MLGKNNVNGGGIKLIFSDGHTENVSSVKYEPTTTLPEGYYPIVVYLNGKLTTYESQDKGLYVRCYQGSTLVKACKITDASSGTTYNTRNWTGNFATYMPYFFDSLEELKKVEKCRWFVKNSSEENITYLIYAKR